MQEDIIGITDENFNKIVEYEYDSWGNIITIKDNNGNIITDESHIGIINPFRYRSYYYDKETKLYYLNSRYYNPEWGRFINCDSLIKAEENKYNLYMYCKNNSIKYSDHLGTMGGAPAGLMPGMLGGAIGGLEAAATGGAGVILPTIAAGIKTAAAIGTVSAVAKGTKQASKSISEEKNTKTVIRETANAALDGFGNGFATGSVVSMVSSLSSVNKSGGVKIGDTAKEQYGRITIGYGSNNNGMTLINYSDKNGKSRFRIDADPKHMVHMHYGKTKTNMEIHRTGIMNIIFGVLSSMED